LAIALLPQYNSFEELPIWQTARVIIKEVYLPTATGEFAKDYGLKNQIQRASVSIASDIAEGFERRSDKEFAQFLNIAKASLGEVRA